MASVKVASVIVMWLAVVGAPLVAEGITCGQVTQSMFPCLAYLQMGGMPSAACCGGVKSVIGGATTTADRQAVCNCLKAAASRIAINNQMAESLPAKCNLNIPYKLSTTINCATIRF